ncbi:MAG: hypothetical protein HY700_11240 [Gemmatimonadetes bacterium]|nr:hypothetical protein [Gemmatimonadota bacterium]
MAKKESTARKTRLIGRSGSAFTVLAAAPTVPVTVTRSVTGDARLGAKLNRKDLRFVNDAAHAVVGKGQQNTLAWAVVGAPGSTFSIKVTEPGDADCGDSGTLDQSGTESGSCSFDT